jgi:hypothetical protein
MARARYCGIRALSALDEPLRGARSSWPTNGPGIDFADVVKHMVDVHQRLSDRSVSS